MNAKTTSQNVLARLDPDYVETAAVVLMACVYPIVAIMLRSPAAERFDLGTFIAHIFDDIGWSLLLIVLLSRQGTFKWNLPTSLRGWLGEMAWGTALFAAAAFVSAWAAWAASWAQHDSEPILWSSALRDPEALLVFRLSGPTSALYQELLFRVYLLTRFSAILKRFGILSVPLSAWLFAVVHGYPPPQAFAMFCVGMLFGLAYYLSRKVPRLVIAHCLNLTLYGIVWRHL